MSLNLPTSAKEVSERMKTDMQNELPVSNPFLKNSLVSALVSSFAGRIFDFYLQLEVALDETFPDTSTGVYLERWGSWVGIFRNPATQAQGNVNATGLINTVVPVGTVFQSSSGNQYTSTEPSTVEVNNQNVLTITRVGSLATVTTVSDNQFATGQLITVSGSDQPEYNGTFPIIVITPDQFQYTVTGTPLTPATGTILSSALMAIVNILSNEFGASQNLDSGDSVSITTPISGLDSIARTEFFGIGGGTDIEDDQSYRARVQFRYQNPVALFNVTAIILQAKTVPGVTRVWVFEITPDVGDVTIYFTRDNDPSPIPGPSQVQDVKDAILQIKSAHTPDSSVIVNAPDPIVLNFSFNSLVPNTTTMQSSITASLEAFFKDSTEVGVDLPEDAYRCAIFSTIDSKTGESVQSFILNTPVGDIAVNPGELPILGNITYP